MPYAQEMFQMEKATGWKERGAGMLKVNVPKTSIEISEHGYLDMSSLDVVCHWMRAKAAGAPASVLSLRQDHTYA